ncbi:unnamed protein product [Prorocentrum cordatum]|uniref:ATP synthase F1 complex delta/epsilon subunit N-terminal domain-containing protein n=1 Tax=Prorocentrum cordatum TaxID=2364126 RepID=A0ABN9U6M5_9DINO|nr:unnamed protein product [Polarella glacialis]
MRRLRALPCAALLGVLLPALPRAFVPGLQARAGAAGAPGRRLRPPRGLRGGVHVGRAASGADEGEDVSVDRIMLKVYTPEGENIQILTSQIVLPGVEGQLGILRGHAPMLAPVTTGLVRYKRQGKWNPLVVFGGYASVESNIVTILCTNCEKAADVPEAKEVKAALEKATAELSAAKTRKDRLSAIDKVRAASARLQATAMLSGSGRAP